MSDFPELSNSRKIIFTVILLLITVLVIEVMAQVAFRAIYDHSYRPKKLHQLTSSSWIFNQDEVGVPGHLSDLVIHPYLGFAINNKTNSADDLGFGQTNSPIESRQHKDKLRILVLGGSVAVQLALRHGADNQSFLERALTKELKKQNVDLDVWMFNAALPGFKQPQQFISYSYLMTLGAEFDVVINVDGFNEMTLAVLEGSAKGLHPAYPRGWDVMLGNQGTAASLRKVGRLLRVRDEQASLLESAQSSLFGRSAILGLFFAHRVAANEARANTLVTEIEHQKLKGKLSFEAGGPSFDFEDENETYGYLAELWSNSSKLLETLVSSKKASYIQVFQPNQYLQGSKPLSEVEKKKYFFPEDGFGKVYRSAYPYFSKHITAMETSSDWFVDSSGVFTEETDTVYSDVCCHFNEHGLKILADSIAQNAISRSMSVIVEK